MTRQWLLLFTVCLYGFAFWINPERAANALRSGAGTFASVILLIIAVFGLVGLLQVWANRDVIIKLLGRDSGLKGLIIATLCDTGMRRLRRQTMEAAGD